MPVAAGSTASSSLPTIHASIIVMSDCGDPINHFLDQLERLRKAQTEALAAMESAGIEVQDVPQSNTVFNGTTVFDFEIGAEDMARIDALDKGKEGAITWNPVDVD
ncbi:hypothetical protein NUW54_g8484 [Trametes sanguinea]|uniref:Uncharacterized protein n=1 Tax=Trametes sanguinea TaxID=158606 RepID=A0ACC1PFF0_9APHY|nr:hypothetical protein NUW54_g8484 [Trametes sanguinea]